MTHPIRSLLICAFTITAACANPKPDATSPVAAQPAERDTIVIAVRHAEKATDDPRDPTLNDAGQRRAVELMYVLEHANVSAIYTSQFRRTVETAAPLAAATGVKPAVRPINGTDVDAYTADLAREIRQKNHAQVVLVVGHSNTIPALVKALSGVTVAPIDDAEYNRIYTITLGADARVIATKY